MSSELADISNATRPSTEPTANPASAKTQVLLQTPCIYD